MTEDDWQRHLTDHGIYFDLGRTSRSRTRECALVGESSLCNLSITPAPDVRQLSIRDIPANGVLLAVVVNEGVLEETTLRLQPWDAAYWVAWKNADGTDSSALVDFHTRGGHFGTTRRFSPCPGSAHQPAADSATFQYCAHQARAVHIHQSPPWISCVEGCCTAES